eukprot:gene21715-26117_t
MAPPGEKVGAGYGLPRQHADNAPPASLDMALGEERALAKPMRVAESSWPVYKLDASKGKTYLTESTSPASDNGAYAESAFESALFGETSFQCSAQTAPFASLHGPPELIRVDELPGFLRDPHCGALQSNTSVEALSRLSCSAASGNWFADCTVKNLGYEIGRRQSHLKAPAGRFLGFTPNPNEASTHRIPGFSLAQTSYTELRTRPFRQWGDLGIKLEIREAAPRKCDRVFQGTTYMLYIWHFKTICHNFEAAFRLYQSYLRHGSGAWFSPCWV